MLADRIFNLTCLGLLALALALATAVGGASAQEAALAPDQVPGARLQFWLDQKFAFAGVNHTNGCYTMTTGGTRARVQFLSCTNGFAEKLSGSSRVVGNSMCSTFPYPGQPVVEQCRQWHKVGENKFEVRFQGKVTSTQYRLTK